MSNIKFLIQYEQEGTKLDFKREQYRKRKYKDLIKDIMTMVNGLNNKVSFIRSIPSMRKCNNT